MGRDITRVHHVGHVVADLPAALTRYRRLGFTVPPPTCPAIARRDGADPEPFGAANTHADFERNFVELATCVREGGSVPDDARLVPLQASPAVLPGLIDRIATTSANLAACLDRFEGLHILMFSSRDVEATAARLTASGVGHAGVNSVRRAVETENGTVLEDVRYLEIDSGRPGVDPGTVAEGRIGVVEDLAPEIQGARRSDHRNGAIELVEAVLCVADSELAAVLARYRGYLGFTARRTGPVWVFESAGTSLVLVPESRLREWLPGERPPVLPSLVAYTVAVRDLATTAEFLRGAGVSLGRTASGDPFVPAAEAFGAAIAFRSIRRSEHVGDEAAPPN